MRKHPCVSITYNCDGTERASWVWVNSILLDSSNEALVLDCCVMPMNDSVCDAASSQIAAAIVGSGVFDASDVVFKVIMIFLAKNVGLPQLQAKVSVAYLQRNTGMRLFAWNSDFHVPCHVGVIGKLGINCDKHILYRFHAQKNLLDLLQIRVLCVVCSQNRHLCIYLRFPGRSW